MEKIVVGISDEASERAVDWVIERAKRGALEVILIRSFDLVMSDPLEDQRLLARVRDRIGRSSPGTRVSIRIVDRSVPESLVPATADADLLVVGFRHRGFVGTALHSPALQLAAHSHCATVIVPEDWTPTSHRRIAVGLDDDGSSEDALDFAAREAIASDAQLEVVHAWTTVVPGVSTMEGILVDERQMRIVHREDLSEAVAHIRSSAPRALVTGDLQENTTPAALLDRAARADLLVIGSHRRGQLASLILGSAAAEVLRTLRIPLYVVPPLDSRSDTHPEHTRRRVATL